MRFLLLLLTLTNPFSSNVHLPRAFKTTEDPSEYTNAQGCQPTISKFLRLLLRSHNMKYPTKFVGPITHAGWYAEFANFAVSL